MKLLNAFSLNMVELPCSIIASEVSLDEARTLAATDFESAVGHADTAAIFADQLGVPVPANRTTIALEKGERVLVGQYRGPRLPEGVTTLPEGSSIVWTLVEIR